MSPLPPNPLVQQTSLPSTGLDIVTCLYICLTATKLPTSHSGTCCTPWTYVVLTLVSIGLINKAGYTVTFKGGMCTICDTANKVIGGFPKQDRLYYINTHLEAQALTHSATVEISATETHCPRGREETLSRWPRHGHITS